MKNKNYWPHAIIGILLFGVFMVSVSIAIALKNPIQDEDTFLSSKRDVDERINEIIKEQNRFLSAYKPHFFFNSPNEQITLANFSFPYMTKPSRPNDKKAQDSKTYLPHQGEFYVELIPLDNTQENIASIRLLLDSFHQANMLKEISTLSPNPQNPLHYTSAPLHLSAGRWKFIVEITYDVDKKAFFEQEIFVKER
ncbi:hypothetical protein [uncultured Helicobacter sp.]|uniref:hypothetical protein n=1 Tax=uncultured Helicobacter sp. TaxID=175537 RepID=UPI002617B764|nr:hypothetical protein [uncultured Helicobacter sp.]